MHNLSLAEALSLWSDLDDAYYGRAGFGHTAEIYLYRLMRNNPSAQCQGPGTILANLGEPGMIGDACREVVRDANVSLYHLLQHFAAARDVVIEVDGDRLGEWLGNAQYTHRVEVRVVRREREGERPCASRR